MSQELEITESAKEIAPHGHFSFGSYVRSRQFAIRIAIVAVLVAGIALFASSFIAYGSIAALGVMVVPVSRSKSFVLAFLPYVLIWVIFTFLRSFADETILAETLNTKVANFERWLFNGQLPTVTLQDRFFDPNHLRWYDYYFTFTHWSYFIIPHVVAIRLWYKHPARFKQFLSGLTIMIAVGLMIYFLIPSNPPWMAPEPINSPAAAPVYRVMEMVAKNLNGGLYQASNSVIGQSNPIAAMPSMHFAVTFFLIFPAWHAGRKWFLLALYYSLTMAITLIYCGEHYVVDVVMGGLVATWGWFAAGTWIRVTAPLLKARAANAARNATTSQRTQSQPQPADQSLA
jgi:membrane-associated phospholipid phosphatase